MTSKAQKALARINHNQGLTYTQHRVTQTWSYDHDDDEEMVLCECNVQNMALTYIYLHRWALSSSLLKIAQKCATYTKVRSIKKSPAKFFQVKLWRQIRVIRRAQAPPIIFIDNVVCTEHRGLRLVCPFMAKYESKLFSGGLVITLTD